MGIASFEQTSGPGSAQRLAMHGRLTIAHIGDVVEPLRAIPPSGSDLAIDLGDIERIDTSGAWIIHRLIAEWSAAGVPARLENASADAVRLIAEVAANDVPVEKRPAAGNAARVRLERIGRAVIGLAENIGTFLAFLGQTMVVIVQTLVGRRSLRWHAFIHQCEAIGVNALGIVGLLLFLVGIVVAQQGAVQLRAFGAEVFVINLIGRSTLRELGVLLTAIMVAGRSASAFAAQIGSMKLNQEVDALETIGMSPIEVLVVPRVIAMALMMLLLGFYGSVMAILGGGLFVWLSLDIPPVTFVQRLQEVTPLSDLVIGLIKAPVFGIVIAMMGCFQGMQVTGNAESVGARTTQAVVESIFMVIVLDAFFAVFFSALGYN
ncbi:MAG: MlaE family lipid ABC transporter permease subunit [Sandarakinorhabdus sp.]|nr:MlaE family lipid ABC transporter permease subunit [Sandarakinorhabdus sp.]